MESMLPALAFALLIGAQVLAVIVLSGKRGSIYSAAAGSVEEPAPAQRATEAVSEAELPAKAA